MNGWILNEHTISICQALSQHQDISGSDEHASFPPLRKIKKKKSVTEGDTCRAEGECYELRVFTGNRSDRRYNRADSIFFLKSPELQKLRSCVFIRFYSVDPQLEMKGGDTPKHRTRIERAHYLDHTS